MYHTIQTHSRFLLRGLIFSFVFLVLCPVAQANSLPDPDDTTLRQHIGESGVVLQSTVNDDSLYYGIDLESDSVDWGKYTFIPQSGSTVSEIEMGQVVALEDRWILAITAKEGKQIYSYYLVSISSAGELLQVQTLDTATTVSDPYLQIWQVNASRVLAVWQRAEERVSMGLYSGSLIEVGDPIQVNSQKGPEIAQRKNTFFMSWVTSDNVLRFMRVKATKEGMRTAYVQRIASDITKLYDIVAFKKKHEHIHILYSTDGSSLLDAYVRDGDVDSHTTIIEDVNLNRKHIFVRVYTNSYGRGQLLINVFHHGKTFESYYNFWNASGWESRTAISGYVTDVFTSRNGKWRVQLTKDQFMEYRPGSGWVFIDAPYDISQYFYIKVRGTNAQYIRAKEAASTVTYQLWNPFTNEVKAKRIAHKNNDQAYDDTTISFQYLGDHIAATLSLYISQVSSRDLIEIGKAQDFVTDPGADLIYTKTTDLEVDEE